jgi:hypothetical protein
MYFKNRNQINLSVLKVNAYKNLLSVNPSGWLQTCATAMVVAEDGSGFVNTCDLVCG